MCGRLTPVDKGICYHCNAPLPRLELPAGMVVCPNCLRLTPVDTGYCRKCNAPLPPSMVREALRRAAEETAMQESLVLASPRIIGRVVRPGAW